MESIVVVLGSFVVTAVVGGGLVFLATQESSPSKAKANSAPVPESEPKPAPEPAPVPIPPAAAPPKPTESVRSRWSKPPDANLPRIVLKFPPMCTDPPFKYLNGVISDSDRTALLQAPRGDWLTVYVNGDGNCFYRALAQSLAAAGYLKDSTKKGVHLSKPGPKRLLTPQQEVDYVGYLREVAYKKIKDMFGERSKGLDLGFQRAFMQCYADKLQPEEYLRRLREGPMHADAAVAHVLSRVLKVPIIIHNIEPLQNGYKYIRGNGDICIPEGFEFKNSSQFVRLLQGQEHYWALVPADTPTEGSRKGPKSVKPLRGPVHSPSRSARK